MASILFAAPGIERFHLHDRLARLLQTRGHHVTVLPAGAGGGTFWRAQGLPAWIPTPGHGGHGAAPPIDLTPFAEVDVRRAGTRVPSPRAVARAARPLARILPALTRMFEHEPPDVVFFHDARSGLHRLLHFLARERGCRILHSGAGFLPGTLQIDGEGVDGDAASCRRAAHDYRDGPTDEPFLAAALAAWLGAALPPPLARQPFVVPPLRTRVLAALRALWQRQPGEAHAALHGWQRAVEPPLPPPATAAVEAALPDSPFVAVLLQDPRDPRLWLDAPEVDARALVEAARAALSRLSPRLPLVVLADAGAGLPAARDLAGAGGAPLLVRPLASAPTALATALAVVTVNHALGLGALLAGTPVLHLGRAPWALPGVATATTLDRLAEDLPLALAADQSTLRARVLTRLLAQDHVWCSPERPDQNGLLGLALALESAFWQRGPNARPGHRTGPAWPLARPRSAEDRAP